MAMAVRAVGREPLVGQIEVQGKAEAARVQLVAQLGDPRGQRALDGERQVGQP